MKKSIRIIAVAVAAIILCMSLVSCDLFGKKLDGKYKAESVLGLGTTTFTFDGNDVKVSFSLFGKVVSQEGTYKIDDDTITFEWVDEDGEELEDAQFEGSFEFEEKENGDIIIGTTEYELVD